MGTPLRNIRVDDDTWARWQDYAKRAKITTTDLIHAAVEAEIASAGKTVRSPLASFEPLLAKRFKGPDPKPQAKAKGK